MGSRCPVASVVAEAGSSAGGGNLPAAGTERPPPMPMRVRCGGRRPGFLPPPALARPRVVPAEGDARRGGGVG